MNAWTGYDPGYRTAQTNGNVGAGVIVGLLDADVYGVHGPLMASIIRSVAPGAAIYSGSAWHGADLAHLIDSGCQVIAMPFYEPLSVTEIADQIPRASAAGVLMFASTGNGPLDHEPETDYPALFDGVFACAACDPTSGQLIPHGSSPVGKLDIAVPSMPYGSSGATAYTAGVAALWLASGGKRLYALPSERFVAFGGWLGYTGLPLPGGRGRVPRAWSL